MEISKIGIAELAKELAKKHGLDLNEAEHFIAMFIETLHEGLDADGLVKVKGLGTFKITNVKERESIDVNSGERVVIEGHDKLSFTPESSLRTLINRPFEQFQTVLLNEGVDFSNIDFDTLDLDSDQEQKQKEDTLHNVDDANSVSKEHTDSHFISFDNSENGAVGFDETTIMSDSGQDAAIKDDNIYDNSTQAVEKIEEKGVSTIPVVNNEVDQSVVQTVDSNTPKEEDCNIEQSTVASKKQNFKYPLFIGLSLVGGILIASLAFYFGMTYQADRKTDHLINDTVRQGLHRNGPVSYKKENNIHKNVSEEESIDGSTSSIKNNQKDNSQFDSDYYDKLDPRVRTGAYRIVGISKIVTVKKGQTLNSISNFYLGKDMECYVEVFNGVNSVSPGDKIKIPLLKLRKRL